MGLVLSVKGDSAPPSVSCSYTGFYEFRKEMAQLAGIDYDNDRECLNAGDFSTFLCHSDCDGVMEYKQCRSTAIVLQNLMEAHHAQIDPYSQDFCKKLIELLTYAGKKRRRLEFK